MSKKKPRYGLEPNCVVYAAREYVDFDYVDILSEADKDFLDRFSREYYNNFFAKNAPTIHKTAEQKREVYRVNHARRRDMWTFYHRMPHDYTATVIAKDDADE